MLDFLLRIGLHCARTYSTGSCGRDEADDGVLSGTGYIGSFTSLALLEQGYKVIIVDSLYNSSKVSLDRIELICGKRPEFYHVDVTDETALERVFTAHPDIDSVIHFAALKVRQSTPNKEDKGQSSKSKR
jgi:nucleoside-diphosphate-sugar epimerase